MLNNKYFFYKGRVALYALLEAMGIKPGDGIILPGFTCVVVPNAIVYLEGKPIYVDIDPKTYNIDVLKIEEKLTIHHSSPAIHPKAIIAQHTFGIPADMDRILEIARKYNLYVIEDSCHTIGSRYRGKEVGTFGDAAFFSSQWSKPVTTGLGGWAIVNNPEIKEKMDKIYPKFIKPSFREISLLRLQYLTYSKFFKPSLFWFAQDTYRMLSKRGIALGSSSNEELECRMPEGYEKRMSPWQRSLLEKKIAEIDKDINHRKWIASLYEEEFKEKGVETLKLPEHYDPVLLRYPMLVKNKAKAIKEAKRRRMEIGDWFASPVHPNLDGWERVGYRKGICPVAEEVCEHIINLPTHRRIGGDTAQCAAAFSLSHLL